VEYRFPKKTAGRYSAAKHFFKGFEVAHEFPHIGRKVMILKRPPDSS